MVGSTWAGKTGPDWLHSVGKWTYTGATGIIFRGGPDYKVPSRRGPCRPDWTEELEIRLRRDSCWIRASGQFFDPLRNGPRIGPPHVRLSDQGHPQACPTWTAIERADGRSEAKWKGLMDCRRSFNSKWNPVTMSGRGW